MVRRLAVLATALAMVVVFALPAGAIGSVTFGSPQCAGSIGRSYTSLVKTYTSDMGCWHVAVKYRLTSGYWSSYKHEYDYYVYSYQGANITNGGHRVYIQSSTTSYYAGT